MLEAKERSEWSRTTHVLYRIASAFAGKGSRPQLKDFDPFAKQDTPTVSAVQLGMMLGIKERAKP